MVWRQRLMKGEWCTPCRLPQVRAELLLPLLLRALAVSSLGRTPTLRSRAVASSLSSHLLIVLNRLQFNQIVNKLF